MSWEFRGPDQNACGAGTEVYRGGVYERRNQTRHIPFCRSSCVPSCPRVRKAERCAGLVPLVAARTRRGMTNPNARPRAELFRSSAVTAAFAYFLALPEEDQREFHNETSRLLHASIKPRSAQVYRVREAIRSMVEATAAVGGAPTIREFETLSIEHPEWDWCPVRSIKRWLGVRSWDDALARAGIAPPAPTDDVLTRELGDPFTDDEVLAAAKECAGEVARVPKTEEYIAWAHRPDVRARPGRRPLSCQTMCRRFGTWGNVLAAAGLIDDPSEWPRAHTIRYDSSELLEALHLIAGRIGTTPRYEEFAEERRRVLEDPTRDDSRPLPSAETIRRRFGSWDIAVNTANLTPCEQRQPSGRQRDRQPRTDMWSRQRTLAAIREARNTFGDPLTASRYQAWRLYEVERDPRRAYALPSVQTVRRHFSVWLEAVAHSSTDDGGAAKAGDADE
jgi:hypothetical protein